MKVFQPQKRYRLHPGYIAWILHRVTGVLLGLYLFLHIWVIHYLAQGEQAFNEVMSVVQSPLFLVLEVGLLGTVVYHGINGLRVILVDYGNMAKREIFRKAVYVTFALCAAIIIAGGIPMLMHAFSH